MIVLGIETSADETAAAVVQDGRILLGNAVASSIDKHIMFGGIVPEIAARSHLEYMMPVVEKALTDAFARPGLANSEMWSNIDAIAVTQGPGLGGSLLVGVLTARTLAIVKNKPLYAVNHVHAHPFATFLTSFQGQSLQKDARGPSSSRYVLPEYQPEFPMLALIVSGGHSQLVIFRSFFDYDVLGRTGDDAIGEAFDKVAKILGLPYPGGPSIGKKAQEGDENKYPLPKARLESKYDFSFSGLKTAVLRLAQKEIGEDHSFPSYKLSERLSEVQKANIAASFQRVAVETVVDKTILAYEECTPQSVVIAGGVAASPELRRQLAERLPIQPIYTDMKLCTDNGAMIATLGCFMAQAGLEPSDPYTLDIKPSWPM